MSKTAFSPSQLVPTLLRFLGSLAFAVLLLSLLVLVLGTTTFIEAAYNADVVTFFVYNTLWFKGVLFLLCLNVLCSMLSRFPWKRKHLPFLTAHCGILVLLGGCYVTDHWGQEANVSIFEGKSARYALAKGYHFQLTPIIDEEETEQVELETESSKLPNQSNQTEQSQITQASRSSQVPQSTLGPHSGLPTTEEIAREKNLERQRTVQIPFNGGPFNWDDYQSQVWFGNSRPFSYFLWGLMQIVPHDSGTIFTSNANQTAQWGSTFQLDVLDYISHGRKVPAVPLDLTVQWGENGSPESVQLVTKPEIGLYQGSQVELGLGAGFSSGKGQITFRVAENPVEENAFFESLKEPIEQPLGVVQIVDRNKSYIISVEELLKRQMEQRMLLDGLQREMMELNRKRQSVKGEEELQTVEQDVLALSDKILKVQQQGMIPLGESGYRIGLAKFMPDGPAILQQGQPQSGQSQQAQSPIPTGPMLHLTVSGPNRRTDQLVLFSDRADLNTQSQQSGLVGTYWINPQLASEKAAGIIAPTILERLAQPRIDLLQSTSGQLLYRYSIGSNIVSTGTIAPNNQLSLESGTKNAVVLNITKFIPQDFPGFNVLPCTFDKNQDKTFVPDQFARLRITRDQESQEFWIRALYLTQIPFADEPDTDQVRVVRGPGCPIRVMFPSNELDLGFSLYLKKYTHKMEPGSKIPAQFSSWVDMRLPEEVLDRIDLLTPGRPGQSAPKNRKEIVPIQDNVLIKMNQPGVFVDQTTARAYRVYQSSWSGPYGPQSMEYQYLFDKEIFPGEEEPRESIYKSVLSVNYDPGRGLKYLGSAMLVFGTAWLIFRSKRKDHKTKCS
ncbi:MAG: hypothetical protein ACRC10_04925 [Thermoguttaceae bacterium]